MNERCFHSKAIPGRDPLILETTNFPEKSNSLPMITGMGNLGLNGEGRCGHVRATLIRRRMTQSDSHLANRGALPR